jgi:Holliday junction resolvase RusA-like endonuclease
MPGNDICAFTIPGPPVGKARPRFSRRGAATIAYTPGKTARHEERVALIARSAMRGCRPLTGPVQVHVDITMPVPASWSRRRRREAIDRTIAPTVKPDIDNVLKLLLDAMSGICYADDRQIVGLTATKFYGDPPGVRVAVSPASLLSSESVR